MLPRVPAEPPCEQHIAILADLEEMRITYNLVYYKVGLKVDILELLCRALVAKRSGTAAGKYRCCLTQRRTDLTIGRRLEEH